MAAGGQRANSRQLESKEQGDGSDQARDGSSLMARDVQIPGLPLLPTTTQHEHSSAPLHRGTACRIARDELVDPSSTLWRCTPAN